MGTARGEVLISIVFCLVAYCGGAVQPNFGFLMYKLCSSTTYASNSTYAVNLNTLLDKVRSNSTQNQNGFYYLSVGKEPNIIYARAMCRGDVAAPNCHQCFSNLTSALPQACPNFNAAIGWSDGDFCSLYYSPHSMLRELDEDPAYKLCNPTGVPSQEAGPFNRTLSSLMGSLKKEAASGNSTLKFAYGKYSNGPTTGFNSSLYGLLQCTPDLNQTSCYSCLETLIDSMPSMCPLKIGGRLYAVSCIMRYEDYDFITNASQISPPSSPQSTHPLSSQKPTSPPQAPDSGRKRKHVIAGATAAAAAAAAALLIFVICWIFYKKKSKHASDEYMSEIKTAESLQFDLNRIKTATRNFSEDNKLGQGGFGAVYKGILENGQVVAIKRLLRNSGQGIAAFKTEVLLVARLQHRNLVRLLGFCVSGNEKILVYEYLPKTSLDRFLFDVANQECLDWATRYKIISGIAKGLLYLHEDSRLKIIHRDLKPSNILLDNDMNAKIADFGLARLLEVDQTQDETNRIVGTYGYMAPEYAMTGNYSVKSDVYSFGIIVLELVNGQKNRFTKHSPVEEALLYRAWNLWNKGVELKLVDSCLGSSYTVEEVIKCIHIGLLCIQDDPSRRANMASVVASLDGQLIVFPSPTAPDFICSSVDATGSAKQVRESGTQTEGTTLDITETITVIDPR